MQVLRRNLGLMVAHPVHSRAKDRQKELNLEMTVCEVRLCCSFTVKENNFSILTSLTSVFTIWLLTTISLPCFHAHYIFRFISWSARISSSPTNSSAMCLSFKWVPVYYLHALCTLVANSDWWRTNQISYCLYWLSPEETSTGKLQWDWWVAHPCHYAGRATRHDFPCFLCQRVFFFLSIPAFLGLSSLSIWWPLIIPSTEFLPVSQSPALSLAEMKNHIELQKVDKGLYGCI